MRTVRWQQWLILILLISLASGCQLRRRARWHSPQLAKPRIARAAHDSSQAAAERNYAEAVRLERQGDANCVDFYFAAATQAWPDVHRQLIEQSHSEGRADTLYRSALTKLISAGQSYRRLDPGRGLIVHTPQGTMTVPTRLVGFPWRADDFDRLVPVGRYKARDIGREYSCDGLGVATVVIRCPRANEPFLGQQQRQFGATVVLRPAETDDACPACPFVLELFDPQRIRSTRIAGRSIVLRRDTTAPIAWILSQEDRQYLQGFLQPGTTDTESGLFMTEPWQPGKIPIVFVHGLLSDPFTWANMANEIRACPDLVGRYQLWGFEYATGEPFLSSAAVLRRHLREIQLKLDPSGSDPALSQVILVGHSMGGLISKLQITRSGTRLWDAVSCVSLDQIYTSHETRARLADSFFFEPSPIVSRVVFIGTPHRGSPWARRPVGRLGSRLVNEPPSTQAAHQQLTRDNPGVFSQEFTERIPTSIDLLEPDSPLLQAIEQLPWDPRIQLHSIIGNGYWMIGAGESDTVVPAASARKPGVASEKTVHAKHERLHRDNDGIAELFRIMRFHARNAAGTH